MPRARQEEPRIATVRESLDQMKVDQLKQLSYLLPAKERPTRKEDLQDLIERHLTSGERLRELWDHLDEKQKLAVAETIYSSDGAFNAARFQAKYGELPVFGVKKDSWSETPSALRLFILKSNRHGGSVIPEDLKQRLLGFVPEPSGPQLKTEDEPPEFIEMSVKEYEPFEGEEGIVVVEGKTIYRRRKYNIVTRPVPLSRRDTERAAQQDLQTILRLIDKGKVAVSDKTNQPSSATMQEIASLLRDGDFYEPKPKMTKWEQGVGSIKSFAWPLLLQAAKLAELHGKKLALTKAGRNALGAPAEETLRLIWQRWLSSKLLDEFNRVCEIKGQQGKGKRAMTPPEDRRDAIADALAKCPVGRWVKFDEFSRFMRAAGYDFKVTRDPWSLYIADAHYGSLGYEGYGGWHMLQARYALCLLFEYAATLGLIDVAYVRPERARPDYKDQWGTDDLQFLSQYDGLLYFRLNPLGAYCLGLIDEYSPGEIEARVALSALPSMQINVTGGELSPDETLLLETYAEKESGKIWRLSREKALAAVESGNQIKELREFLQARDEQPLPETVEGFIITTERQARALKNTGVALLIECADAELAELIASHERTKRLCLRAGERHLVVKIDAEEQFRKAIHLLGYGMPRV
ncbi:MAG: hypothetical protein ACREAB_18265 [Blastocatellia bacterium]